MIQPDELISVIIPAYNSERFVGATLASVLAQSHRNIEVIVVDDGSTDGTAAIVESFVRQDDRVRLVRAVNGGVCAARNRAIAEARGALIAPIDNDDLWHPEKLARQLAVLRRSGANVGLVYCWTAGIDDDGRIILPIWFPSVAQGDVRHALVTHGIVGNGSVPLIRRSFIEAVGGYDKSFEPGEDWHFYMRLASVCEFAVLPEPLTGYRLTRENYSVNNIDAVEAAIGRMTEWIRQNWSDVSPQLLEERAYNMDEYLTFMAIRRGAYLKALRFRVRAFALRPSRIFSRTYWDFWALLIGHMIGIRRYEWTFWRVPPPFLPG